MGLLCRSLAMLMLVLLLYSERFSHGKAQSSATNVSSIRALDVALQDYAFSALVRPVTGQIYDGTVPSNLTGINVSALRLRSGSLRRKGVKNYKEFGIPKGLIATPYVVRLVLVYQNLGNWSSVYYQTQLPNYTFLSPVLGLLAYDGTDLSAKSLQELNVTVSGDPISVKFDGVSLAPDGAVARCVLFDLQGTFNFSNVTGGNTCSATQQGHFSIVTESISPSPAPAPGPGVTPAPNENAKKKSNKKVWIIVGSVLGGLVLLILLVLLVLCVKKFKQEKRRQQMEKEAEVGEALHMAPVGDTKAPAASGTRTQPSLEHEYAP